MQRKNWIQGLAVLGILAAVTTGCDPSRSPSTVVQTAALSAAEVAEMQAKVRQSDTYFTCWVADELWQLNSGYDCRFASLTDVEILNPETAETRRYNITELRRRYETKGGPEAAKVILAELESTLGAPPPKRPHLGPLGPVLYVGHDRIRQAIYPELHKKFVLHQTAQQLAQARTAWESGDRKAFTETMHAAYEMRQLHFGPTGAQTQEIQTIYQRATGKMLAMEDGLLGRKVVETTPTNIAPAAPAVAKSPTLAEATAAVDEASRLWRNGNPAGGLRKAKQAYEIRRKLLGADHPQTRSTLRMIESAASEITEATKGG